MSGLVGTPEHIFSAILYLFLPSENMFPLGEKQLGSIQICYSCIEKGILTVCSYLAQRKSVRLLTEWSLVRSQQ